MGNTPKLRFEGFTDEWEERKFSDFAQRESAFQLSSAEYPSVEYEDVVAGEGRLNKDVRLKEAQKTGIVFDGTQVLYGKLRPYLHNWLNPDFSGVAVGDWWVLKPVGMDKEFLYRLIQTQQFDAVANLSSGSKMPRADWNLISNTDFIIPASLDEQWQIAEAFDDLDNLITFHQRKCDALTKAKTFYLQNLLPQEREKEPRLRLEGFTDSWNPYTLGDLYTERNERGNETLQILTVSIHTGVSDGALEEDELGKSVRRSEDKTLYKHVYVGDLIFNMMRAWQGAIGVAKREGMISPAYISAIPDERVFPPFMNYLLRRKEIISQINNLSYGVTDFRKRLYWDSFIKVKCSLPSVEEQKRITDVFEQLDTLITRQEHRIKALKTMKKFMLQNMFPQEG